MGVEGKEGADGIVADKHFLILNVSLCFDTCLHKQQTPDCV